MGENALDKRCCREGWGQAKPVETLSVFGLEEYVDKHPALAGAYTGPNPQAKPDNYGDRAVDAELFLKTFAKWWRCSMPEQAVKQKCAGQTLV